ncbi:MAG: hypothetical protein J0M01_02535 [Dechloromonas sp.]|nr:hypothetical protein [Dechloromonas sp.]MBN8555360.1 hypothetical protein [Deltaproteobacteria bacterium]
MKSHYSFIKTLLLSAMVVAMFAFKISPIKVVQAASPWVANDTNVKTTDRITTAEDSKILASIDEEMKNIQQFINASKAQISNRALSKWDKIQHRRYTIYEVKDNQSLNVILKQLQSDVKNFKAEVQWPAR